ncbi:MAG: AAA family ATPase [Paludibacteraceae bacterium]|nr:AAA family ATPase [Paludibacteraceae bacterium]
MLERKFSYFIEDYLSGQQNKILLVNGARQIGKSFIIRYVGNKLFKNFIEIDLRADSEKERIFADVTSLDSFYLQLSSIVGNRLGEKSLGYSYSHSLKFATIIQKNGTNDVMLGEIN